MTTSSYKSLDRPFDFFGLKGKWVVIFLIGTGIGILLGIILGVMMTSAIGIATVFLVAVASFVLSLLKQQEISDRKLGRALAAPKCRINVTRREQLSRILLPSDEYERIRPLVDEKKKQIKSN